MIRTPNRTKSWTTNWNRILWETASFELKFSPSDQFPPERSVHEKLLCRAIRGYKNGLAKVRTGIEYWMRGNSRHESVTTGFFAAVCTSIDRFP